MKIIAKITMHYYKTVKIKFEWKFHPTDIRSLNIDINIL